MAELAAIDMRLRRSGLPSSSLAALRLAAMVLASATDMTEERLVNGSSLAGAAGFGRAALRLLPLLPSIWRSFWSCRSFCAAVIASLDPANCEAGDAASAACALMRPGGSSCALLASCAGQIGPSWLLVTASGNEEAPPCRCKPDAWDTAALSAAARSGGCESDVAWLPKPPGR